MKSSANERHQKTLWIAYLGLAFLNTGFMVCSFLRELPEFWTNAGGYPILFREVLQVGYYPLLGVLLFLHLVLAICYHGLVARLLNALISLPLCVGLAIAWSNNIMNLWEGRPLHWHP
jgi:hypothetical protein